MRFDVEDALILFSTTFSFVLISILHINNFICLIHILRSFF